MATSYNGLILRVWNVVRHLDIEKYWKRREYISIHRNLRAWYYLYWVKKIDAFHNASLGTHLLNCAEFKSMPVFPHGLNGIIVSNEAVIGKNCTIYHQVTIGGAGGAPVIGDNVLIGAGAKIIGPVKIGDNVKIGANCVVPIDVPEGATVVMPKPRIIVKE